MKIIDLTHDIENGMQIFPGDPEISISEGLVHEKDYCHVDKVHLNSHTGTHIDAPLHFIVNGKTITDYNASKFVNEGIAIDLRYKKAGAPIMVSDLEASKIHPGDCVLLVTGWYRYFGDEKYLNHPYISKEAAQYLVERQVSIVAVDFLNVDQTLIESWDAHPVLLENDTLIVENTSNTEKLNFNRRYLFSFLPLKIKGSDGSPVRGIAMELV